MARGDGKTFYDCGGGWRNVVVGPHFYGDREAMVIATLASSEDPLDAAYLSPDTARTFARALMDAADEADKQRSA